jgi:hypothetical protein
MSQISAQSSVNTVTPPTVPGPFYMNEGVPTPKQFNSVMSHMPQEAVGRINKARAEAGMFSLFDPEESANLRKEWLTVFHNERKQLNNLYFASKTALPKSDPETEDEGATPRSASGKDINSEVNNSITPTET